MKTNRIIISLSLCLLLTSTLGVKAQDGAHWQCDIYDYEYDMALYFVLTLQGVPITDFTNYEVAVFSGDECCGIAEPVTTESAQVGYIRVRSKNGSGEKLKFKVFDKSANKELNVNKRINFSSQSLLGLPSNPIEFPLIRLIGDVNDDGKVNIVDVTTTISYILNESLTGFVEVAADVNDDGIINIVDVTTIIDMILKQK